MRRRRSPLLLAVLAMLAACISAGERDHGFDDWKTLQLKARGAAFLRGEVELERIVSEGGDGRERQSRLETRSVARFLGATLSRSTTVTTFDPETGRTLGSVTRGKKRGRDYTFREGGYTVDKLKPAGDEWNVTFTNEFEHPAELFDYYGMLLHLRHEQLNRPGDEITVHVATSGGPRLFRILVAETRVKERRFIDATSGSRRSVQLREHRLRIIPPEGTEGGFLDMEGETEVWVEARTKTPVEINGQIPRVPGRVSLMLESIGW